MPIVTFLATPIVTKQIRVLGFKVSISLGLFLTVTITQSLSMFLISLAPLGPFPAFLILSLLSRISGGIAFAYIYTAGFSLITEIYSEDKERYLSMAELCAGTGLIGGPLIMVLLHGVLSFTQTLIGIAVLILLFKPVTIYSVPNAKIDPNVIRGNMWAFLKDKNILLDLSVNFVVNTCFLYIDPILGIYMDDHGYSSKMIGVAFIVETFFYVSSCILLAIFPKVVSHYRLQLTSCVCACFGVFLIGGVEYIFGASLGAILTGLSFLGIGGALSAVNTVPSIIETYE